MNETTSMLSDIFEKAKVIWAWLDKPAEWFGAGVSWWPKASLIVAIAAAAYTVLK